MRMCGIRQGGPRQFPSAARRAAARTRRAWMLRLLMPFLGLCWPGYASGSCRRARGVTDGSARSGEVMNWAGARPLVVAGQFNSAGETRPGSDVLETRWGCWGSEVPLTSGRGAIFSAPRLPGEGHPCFCRPSKTRHRATDDCWLSANHRVVRTLCLSF